MSVRGTGPTGTLGKASPWRTVAGVILGVAHVAARLDRGTIANRRKARFAR